MVHPYLQAVERTLLTFWIGGLWTTGFVVAPLLFAELDDRVLAGTLAAASQMSAAKTPCRDRRRIGTPSL